MLLHASIHFPLAREDQGCLVTLLTLRGLQSTSLLRGKTRIRAFPVMPAALQSTSLLRGKTEVSFDRGHDIVLQSTSLLRGKTSAFIPHGIAAVLQSTSLLRGKTYTFPDLWQPSHASIHFPLAREDLRNACSIFTAGCFNPLPSCEGRLSRRYTHDGRFCFNPLPSCEGRLIPFVEYDFSSDASIHFPLAWEDSRTDDNPALFVSLQSTSLLRGKTIWLSPLRILEVLQSTSLLRGKTWCRHHCPHCNLCFNPLPSCEGRLLVRSKCTMSEWLQSTSLLRGKTH